jgi:hypothetical protein
MPAQVVRERIVEKSKAAHGAAALIKFSLDFAIRLMDLTTQPDR